MTLTLLNYEHNINLISYVDIFKTSFISIFSFTLWILHRCSQNYTQVLDDFSEIINESFKIITSRFLLMCRNKLDLCILTLYPVTSLKLFISSCNFGRFLRFSGQIIMLFANENNVNVTSFPILITFIYFFCMIVLSRSFEQ